MDNVDDEEVFDPHKEEEDIIDNPKHILITWGFDRDGTLYLDSYLEIIDRQKDVASAKMMELRCRFQMTNMSLIRTDKSVTREIIEDYVLSAKFDKSVISKLKDAQVRVSDLTRELAAHNSINFILDS